MTDKRICGHDAGQFRCDRVEGHKGLHAQHDHLRGGLQVTNWGDDGLAPWATRDFKRLKEQGY